MTSSPEITRLREVKQQADACMDTLFSAVARAREAARPWSEIAEAVDLSVAAATARYRGGQVALDSRRALARKRANRRPSVSVPAAQWPGVSLSEAAESLGVSAETVRRRLHGGGIRGGLHVDELGRKALRVTDPVLVPTSV